MELTLAREDFINQYPPSNFLSKKDLQSLWSPEGFNLYVHIPYCHKKCEFCYYKAVEIGDEPVPDEYVQALLREMELYSGNPFIRSKKTSAVYFGGGTPTKLTGSQINKLMAKVKECFNLASDYELCFEARPGLETDEEKLRLLREHNLRRLSLGLQSMDDEVLSVNGRNHSVSDFTKAFELAKKVKIPSINIDIMSGMAGQSLDSWMDTVEKVIELHPENITIYKLEAYLNIIMFKKLRSKDIKLISNEEEADYVKQGFKTILHSGYLAVTNFSFSINEAHNHVHRKMVWAGEDLLGIGASARSCINDVLFQNEINIEHYTKRILKDGELPIMRAYDFSPREAMIQRIVFGLKSMNYETQPFYDEFGVDVMTIFGNELRRLQEMRFVQITDTHIMLTFEGMVYADDIVRLFYLPHQQKSHMSHVFRG
ncbi:MAG: coproporphyrinogen III oxidase family protein [Chitinispirillales bacterium]|jgi:oxygen-independent coproporphyrinogen-3 oxidase|nr:coproporphyrinogen III oxidase family protein [Chitinispirillales bacterium]